MKILVACEESGKVRDAFTALGHYAVSCDLLPTRSPGGMHYQGDVRDVLGWWKWDMLLGFPPCTFVCGSGLHWNNRGRGWDETHKAIAFFRLLWEADIDRICLENPVGILSKEVAKPTQYIQPYEYGDDASKKTCLWLKGVPPLTGTKYVKPRLVCAECKGVSTYDAAFTKGCTHCGAEPGRLRPRWANQTDSGQNKLGPSDDRALIRSETYQGIADAMAAQWGKLAP